jgi:hypothetical protein
MSTSSRIFGTGCSGSHGEAIISFFKSVRSKIRNTDSDMNPVDKCHQLKMWVIRPLLPIFFISLEFRYNVGTARSKHARRIILKKISLSDLVCLLYRISVQSPHYLISSKRNKRHLEVSCGIGANYR